MNIVKEAQLTALQEKQLKQIVKAASSDPFLDGDVLSTRPKNIVLEGEDVAGFFTPYRQSWKGRPFWRPGALYVGTQYRGKNLMYQALSSYYNDSKRNGIAWIDDRNVASIALFTKLGFVKDALKEVDGQPGHWWIMDKDKDKTPRYAKW